MEKSHANPGDLVEIHLTKIIYEGVLLESPETGIILLKLGTGYNIGFNKKDVLEMLVISENGLGKRTLISEYKVQGRGGSGIKTMAITPKTGRIIYRSRGLNWWSSNRGRRFNLCCL